MALLSARLFHYAAIPAWPRRFGLRLLAYLAMSLAAWLLPPWGALGALAAVLLLGHRIPWPGWLLSLGWLWLFVLAPVLLELAAGRFSPPALWRSLTFLVLLAASQWLSATSTIFEIRASLHALFRIFGRRIADALSLAGALALCFIPWVIEQLDAAHQAGQLRGLPPHRPLLALRALSIPVFIRIIAKAQHTAEALELRGR